MQHYFKESKSCIFTMASVHEEIYESENFQKVNLKTFLNLIIPDIVHLYSQNTLITYEIDTEEILVQISLAIPSGLIVNEVVTNNFQHVFPNYEHGRIDICYNIKDSSVEWIIRDNGIGMPDT